MKLIIIRKFKFFILVLLATFITISAGETGRTTASAREIVKSRNGYNVDVLQTYGSGTSYSKASIDAALAAIGTTTKATLLLRPGTWTITSSADYSAYKNITWKIPAGAVLRISTGATLTLNGSLETGRQKIFTTVGTGKVVFHGGSVKEVYPEWWTENAVPGTTDMTTAIQAAIDSTSKEVIITGTNLVDSNVNLGGGWAFGWTAFKMKSNMHIKGIPGKSIIKVKNGISSKGSPVNFDIFASQEDLDDISFYGITFDLNGQNNLISPLRPASYNRNLSFAIVFGMKTGRVDNLTVENCVFQNAAGTNVIVVNIVTGGEWATLSNNVIIRNNQFIDNGMDTDDHTTIMMNATNAFIYNNIFTSPNYSIKRNTAIQVDGPRSKVAGNFIDHYAGGIVIGENFANYVTNKIEISKNFIKTYFSGVWFDHPTSPRVITCGISDVDIHDNIFEIVDSPSTYSARTTAFYLYTAYSISNISIHDNRCYKSGGTTHGAVGLYMGKTVAGQKSDNIHIENNTFKLFTVGIQWLGIASDGSGGRIYIRNNTIDSARTSTTPALDGIGIYLNVPAGQMIDYIDLSGNKIYNSSVYGIALSGTFITMRYGNDNIIQKSGKQNYIEQATVKITTRQGVRPSTVW